MSQPSNHQPPPYPETGGSNPPPPAPQQDGQYQQGGPYQQGGGAGPQQHFSQMERSPQWLAGSKASQMSMIFGLIGFFVPFVGIILGPLAIKKAKEAESLNNTATVGKVFGWIDTIGVAIYIVILIIVGIIVATSGS